jgi:hypothetical protein
LGLIICLHVSHCWVTVTSPLDTFVIPHKLVSSLASRIYYLYVLNSTLEFFLWFVSWNVIVSLFASCLQRHYCMIRFLPSCDFPYCSAPDDWFTVSGNCFCHFCFHFAFVHFMVFLHIIRNWVCFQSPVSYQYELLLIVFIYSICYVIFRTFIYWLGCAWFAVWFTCGDNICVAVTSVIFIYLDRAIFVVSHCWKIL